MDEIRKEISENLWDITDGDMKYNLSCLQEFGSLNRIGD